VGVSHERWPEGPIPLGPWLALVAMVLGALAGMPWAGVEPALAQPTRAESFASGGEPLAGVLARIRRSGAVRLGYREHALPFSFAGPSGVPYGYSIDLCLAIVEEIGEAIGGRAPRVEYRPVTPENRLDLVVAGEIDLECGATSNTAERRQRVAFSPVTFVTGTRLAVPRNSNIRTRRDLAGRAVAVARGSTNEQAIREVIAKSGMRTEILTADDLPGAFGLVASGRAAAVASDDVLLLGYLAETGQRAQYAVVGELLSWEAYGIVYSSDDRALAEAVNAAFQRLARTRELRWIYHRWFVRQLPSGVKLALPMGAELQRAFELLGLPAE
jgi:glutamate/aspartate transport system substrate-binding protein